MEGIGIDFDEIDMPRSLKFMDSKLSHRRISLEPQKPPEKLTPEQIAKIQERLENIAKRTMEFKIDPIQNSDVGSLSMIKLDELISNPGLQYIAEQILVNLDYQTLANCREVSKSWRDFIDQKKSLIKIQIRQTISHTNGAALLCEKTGNFICKICDKTFVLHAWLKDHMVNHKFDSDRLFETKMDLDDLEVILKFMKNFWNPGPKHKVLQKVWNINSKNMDSRTLLHFACRAGRVQVVKAILNSVIEIDINIEDKYGHNVLHEACMTGSLEIVDLLLKHQSIWEKTDILTKFINAQDHKGFTPLLLACSKRFFETVILILDHALKTGIHIELNTAVENGRTPLHYACLDGFNEVVKRLLKYHSFTKSFDINARNKNGMTPLNVACANKNFGIVEAILDYSAECENIIELCNADTNMKRNPLHYASRSGQTGIVKKMLNNHSIRTNVNTRDKSGSTGLHYACKGGHIEVVKQLLNCYNSNVNIRDNSGKTPMDYASLKGHKEIVTYLATTRVFRK